MRVCSFFLSVSKRLLIVVETRSVGNDCDDNENELEAQCARLRFHLFNHNYANLLVTVKDFIANSAIGPAPDISETIFNFQPQLGPLSTSTAAAIMHVGEMVS